MADVLVIRISPTSVLSLCLWQPENLLYESPSEDAIIKVADFGFAKELAGSLTTDTMCGTPGYFAPEIISRRPVKHIQFISLRRPRVLVE